MSFISRFVIVFVCAASVFAVTPGLAGAQDDSSERDQPREAEADTTDAYRSSGAAADTTDGRTSGGRADTTEAARTGEVAADKSGRTRTSEPADTTDDAREAELAAEPYHFVSKQTITRAPGPRYEAGGIKRWLLGKEYRGVWATPMAIPVIDLEETAGGLTPLERGGGMQTTSLHLVGEDGHFYVLRSVDKTVDRSLAPGFRGTFISSIAQDQTSSMNPVGALITTPLASAAGILHTHPTQVIIPDSPRLGEFRQEYAGMLAQFERKADEDQSGAARFGFSENIVGSTKMFEETREDNDERVDERAYARARLFDMLIGDWDRHDEQWRWAEFETEHGIRFVPVPKDRDFAFVKFDGFANRLGRLLGPMTLRRLGNFDNKINDVLALNWQGSKLDRQLTPSLTREDWIELADSLRLTLTDDVIDQAVRMWPDPVFNQVGEMTARSLKSRRDQLPDVASEYYDLLAETVDVVGTDKHERFEITRLNSKETQLVLLKTKKEGDVVRELFRRTFLHDETDEIRLYGLGGNDQFILEGQADDGVLIRIIGGEGDDIFVDNSVVSGPGHLTRFYDTVENTVAEAGPESSTRLSRDPRINEYIPSRFELNPITPVASVDYNSDDGIFLGGGVRFIRSGFRKDPYAAMHLIRLNIAPRSRAYNAYYDGRLISVWNDFDARLEADALTAREFRHFYGLGNETARSDRSRFLAEMQTVTVVPSMRRTFGKRSYVEFGPRAQYVNVDPREGLNPGDPGVGFSADDLTDKYLAGFQSTIALDSRDSTLNPRSGFLWRTQASYDAAVRTSSQQFGRFSSELSFYYTLPVPGQITFALRAGGATNVGSFPFFEASTLGRDNLRGFPRSRFSGRSAVFGNADLRMKLFDFNIYLLKGEFGALGFIDHGRVWADDEDSDLWHRGYGGGLWLSPFNLTVLSASLGFSDDGRLLDLSVGFQY